MVWRHDQAEPFGDNPPDENPSGLGVFEFPLRDEGTYFDKETGLLYNMNRYRDTSGGRFLQADPLGLYGGDLSLYVLRGNDPLSFTDPLGLTCRGKWLMVHSEKAITYGQGNLLRDFLNGCWCYWLCQDCDSPSMYGDPRSLPKTAGTWVYSPAGEQAGESGNTGARTATKKRIPTKKGRSGKASSGVGGGNTCIGCEKPDEETGCNQCTPNYPGPRGVQAM